MQQVAQLSFCRACQDRVINVGVSLLAADGLAFVDVMRMRDNAIVA